MTAILQLIIISTISAAFARRLLERLEPNFDSVGERLLFEYSIGLGLLGMLLFVLGALRLFYAPVFILLLLGMAAVGWRKLSDIVREIIGGVRGLRTDTKTVGGIAVTGIVLVIGALTLVRSLAPPIGDDWDSLAYHLAVPKLFLAHHGFYYIPFTSHSNFPFTWEMLYTLGLGLGSIGLAKIFHFAAWVLTLWALRSLGSRYFGRASAGLAVLAFAGIPIATWEATSGYIDLASTLFTMLVVYSLMNFTSTKDRRWAIFSAICAGIAAGTKMTSLAMIGVVVLWLLWPVKGESLRNRIGNSLIGGAISSLIAAPWYIKSWIYTGNPVYPFFYGLFGGRNWSSVTAGLYRADQLRFGVGHGLVDFLRLPYDLTRYFARFHDYGARTPDLDVSRLGLQALDPTICSTWIGPAVAILFIFAIIAAFLRGTHRPMLVVALALTAMWFVAMQNVRYLIPALALVTPAAAWAADRLGARRPVMVVAGLAAIFTIYVVSDFARPAAGVVFGLESRQDYLSRFDLYRASEFVNTLPRDAKIALFGETRGFYIDRDYLWADSGHNAIIPEGTEAERVAWLHSHGYNYILVSHGTPPPGTEEVYADPAGTINVYSIVDAGHK